MAGFTNRKMTKKIVIRFESNMTTPPRFFPFVYSVSTSMYGLSSGLDGRLQVIGRRFVFARLKAGVPMRFRVHLELWDYFSLDTVPRRMNKL